MRYMKTVVAAVLIVTAVFFLALVLAQVFTGYDFSAAYEKLGKDNTGEDATRANIKQAASTRIIEQAAADD